jgi:putative ABC transport system permease protein
VVRPLFGYQPGGPEAPSGEPLQFDGRVSLKAFHDHRMTHQLMVVNDETFAALQAMPGAGATVNVHGYKLARWQDSLEAAQQLNREMKDGGQLRATALIYQFQREDSILMLFLAAFLGLLFFLAAGNMLYFKLMTDLYEDRLQFQALYKLGAGVREVRQVVTAHTLVLFAAPMGVALLHTAVAMSVFRVVLGVPSLWRPTLAVVLVYLVLYGAYFLVTRRTYARAILPAA